MSDPCDKVKKMVIEQGVEKTLNAQCTTVKAQENTNPFTLYKGIHLPSKCFTFSHG